VCEERSAFVVFLSNRKLETIIDRSDYRPRIYLYARASPTHDIAVNLFNSNNLSTSIPNSLEPTPAKRPYLQICQESGPKRRSFDEKSSAHLRPLTPSAYLVSCSNQIPRNADLAGALGCYDLVIFPVFGPLIRHRIGKERPRFSASVS